MNVTVFEKSTKPKAIEEFLDFYFYRRVAALLVPIFHKLKISPNMVTWMSMFLGVFGGLAVYEKKIFLGVFLFLLSIFFDCADGQLARITGTSGPMGRVLDGLADLVCVVCLWVGIYFSGLVGGDENHLKMTAIILAGASMIFHCWRYDNVKIKSLELVETNYHETDLDVKQAMQLARDEVAKYHMFNAFLALLIAAQMYFFVRGNAEKKVIVLTDAQRTNVRALLEPQMRFWSWLGVGHHNTLVLMGLALTPWTVWGLWAAFFVIGVPMNIWFVVGEVRFARVYALTVTIAARNKRPANL